MKYATYLASAGALAITCSAAQAADIRIGVPNWAAAEAISYMMDKLVEAETGLDVERIASTNPVIFKAIHDGELHAHPDVWLPNQANLTEKYVDEEGSVKLSSKTYDGFAAYCVTRKTAEDLAIASIYDLADPEIADKFPKGDNGKPDIWVGASGWASTAIDTVRMKSFGVSETFNITELDETLAMTRIKEADQNGTYLATLCFAPHLMFQLADLVKLEEPEYDESKWTMVQPTDDPDWLEKSDIEVAFPPMHIQIAYAASLEEDHPRVAEIFAGIQLDTETVNGWVYDIVEGRISAEDVIDTWMATNQDRVNGWLGL